MGKSLIIILSILLMVGLVVAVNFEYRYNPYSGKRDRTISLNQTQMNFTEIIAGNISGVDLLEVNRLRASTAAEITFESVALFNELAIFLQNVNVNNNLTVTHNVDITEGRLKITHDPDPALFVEGTSVFHAAATQFIINDSDGVPDNRTWVWIANEGFLSAQASTDDLNEGGDVFKFSRNRTDIKLSEFFSTDTIFYGTLTANSISSQLEWVNLTNYPVACPAGSAITQLGDSVTCTDSWVNTDGDTITGEINITGKLNMSGTPMILDTFKGTYTGGNASLCIYDNGTLYTSDDGGC